MSRLALFLYISVVNTIVAVGVYILVTRYALVERIVAAVLRRGLRGVSDGARDGRRESYKVTRTDAGKMPFLSP